MQKLEEISVPYISRKVFLHDCKLVIQLPESTNLGLTDHFNCPIHMGVVLHPVVDACGHTFCDECISKWIEEKSTCPLTNKLLTSPILYPNLIVKEITEGLKIKCMFSDRGCTWDGKIGNLRDHVDKECPEVKVKCRFGDCECYDFRKNITSHEAKCPSSQIKCEYCNNTYHYDSVKEHINTCKSMSVNDALKTRINFLTLDKVIVTSHSKNVNRIVPHDNNKKLITGSLDGGIKVWDLNEGFYLNSFVDTGAFIKHMFLLADGRLISGGGDCKLRIWNTEEVKCEKQLSGHTSPIGGMIEVAGLLISGSFEGELCVWDIKAPEQILEPLAKKEGSDVQRQLLSMALVNKNMFVATSGTKVNIYNVEDMNQDNGYAMQILRSIEDESDVLAVRGTYNPQWFLSSGVSKCCKLWDISSGNCVRVFSGHSEMVWTMLVISEEVFASGSSGHDVIFWDMKTGKILKSIVDEDNKVCCFAKVGEDRIATAGYDRKVSLWKF